MPKANVTFDNIGLTVTVPAGTRLIEISEKSARVSPTAAAKANVAPAWCA